MATFDVDGPGARMTAHQFAYTTIRRAIITGQVPPGDRLAQNDLAQQLSVSTTPVREALRDLAAEGLISLDPHRGAVVNPLSADELNEIYDLRRILEPVAIERAARMMSATDLDEAETLLDLAEDESDVVNWVELNRKFHQTLIDATRSPRLASFLGSLQDSATRYIVSSMGDAGASRRRRSNAQHRELLAAIRQRDVEKAQEIMAAHISQTVAPGTESAM